MKKLVLLFALISMFGMSLSAQVSERPDAEAERIQANEPMKDADMYAKRAAALDKDITREVCSKSGKVSYYKKSVCEKSGKVSISQVKWNNDAKSFDKVAENNIKPAKAKSSCGTKAKSSCGSKGKASCGSKAKSASKGCCSGSKAKSCGSKKS